MIIAFGFMFSIPAGLAGEELSYSLLLFTASLLLLVKSAGYLVNGSSRLAHYFGIPPIIIGITIVAFGTSLPELTVSVLANLTGSAGIAVGNVVGSNISNICLVLGAAIIIMPIRIKREILGFDAPFLIGISILLPVLSLRMFFDLSQSMYVLGLIDGLLLLGLFCFYLLIRSYSRPMAMVPLLICGGALVMTHHLTTFFVLASVAFVIVVRLSLGHRGDLVSRSSSM